MSRNTRIKIYFIESVSKLYSEIIYNKTVEDILEYLYLLYRIVVYVDDVVITGSDNMAYSNT